MTGYMWWSFGNYLSSEREKADNYLGELPVHPILIGTHEDHYSLD